MTIKTILACALSVAGLALCLPVRAHSEHDHSSHGATAAVAMTGAASAPAQYAWGRPGNPKAVTRTVRLSMNDAMRFTPSSVSVRQGETVRFLVRNEGQLMHEIVLGTPQTLEEHAQAMARQPDMPHDAPYMAHVAPGRTGEIVWHFNRAGQVSFACLIAGHYQAGMVGKMTVKPR